MSDLGRRVADVVDLRAPAISLEEVTTGPVLARYPASKRFWSARVAGVGMIIALPILVLVISLTLFDRTPRSDAEMWAGFRAHETVQGFAFDALVQGTVELNPDNGCVWLAHSDGTRSPVIWPLGTVIKSNPARIILPDGQVARAGDWVSGGGRGYVDANSATAELGLEPFPAECFHTDGGLTDGGIGVFNSEVRIELTPGT